MAAAGEPSAWKTKNHRWGQLRPVSDVWQGIDSSDSHSAVLHEFYKSAKGTQALIYCFLGVSALQKHDPIKLKMAANTFSIGEESNITPQVWGQQQARGAGRCRRQGNIYFYATVVTAIACCCCLAFISVLGREAQCNEQVRLPDTCRDVCVCDPVNKNMLIHIHFFIRYFFAKQTLSRTPKTFVCVTNMIPR